MSEEKKQKLLAEYGELSLKMETMQAQLQALGQRMNAAKGELQKILKEEEEKGVQD